MNFYEKIVNFIHQLGNVFTIPNFTPEFSKALNFINFALYFVPVKTLLSIFSIWVAINVISFLIRVIKTVWDIVPMA